MLKTFEESWFAWSASVRSDCEPSTNSDYNAMLDLSVSEDNWKGHVSKDIVSLSTVEGVSHA
jgi:hypothetical protein